MHLSGTAVHRTDSRGHPVRDENFTLLFNAHHDTMDFVLPPLPAGRCWRVELETELGIVGEAEHLAGAATRTLGAPLHCAADGSPRRLIGWVIAVRGNQR